MKSRIFLLGLLIVFLAAGPHILTPAASTGIRTTPSADEAAAKRAPTIEDLLALKSVGGAQISPDGTKVAYTVTETDLDEDAYITQIWLADIATGRTLQLTRGKKSCSGPSWSPDGRWVAFTSSRADDKSQLFVIDPEGGEAIQLTKAETGVSFYRWSPDSRAIAFVASDPVSQPGPDSSPLWSPDGRFILFSSVMGRPDYYARSSRLAVVPAEGGPVRSLTDAFDENPYAVAWNAEGIWFSASQRTAAHLFRLDPETQRIERVSSPDWALVSGASFSNDGKRVAFVSHSPTTLGEIMVTGLPWAPRPLTRMTNQVAGFILGTREIISWKSKDGTEIEGVLVKPADFDPSKKYALLCVIHGGPTAVDRPILAADLRYYPTDIWAARGALILKVNYRGSAGYGEKFRRLNYRNLGVGDAWDVVSGVEHLVKKAATPTLIQHGEFDRRVPIPNAYELRQGLEDQGVPVEMIVYKGYGHGITKPKSMRAAMNHNVAWFGHYIFGDPEPDLAAPPLPEKSEK